MQRPRSNRRTCMTHANSAINSDCINTDMHYNSRSRSNNNINTSMRNKRFVSIAILVSALTLAPFATDAFSFTANTGTRINININTRINTRTRPAAASTTTTTTNRNRRSFQIQPLSMLEKAVYERDSNGNQVMSQTYTSNTEAQASSHVMKKRIVKLLSDDHGEEDDEIPDYSLEAANEVADKRVYSKISEEAKWKANAVMQKSDLESLEGGEHGHLNGHGHGFDHGFDHHVNANDMIESKVIASRYKPVTKVMASVKETGGDSIGEYVKSIGSHELLPQESEMLLGKHIQLLVKWEEVRGGLENDLDR